MVWLDLSHMRKSSTKNDGSLKLADRLILGKFFVRNWRNDISCSHFRYAF